MSRRISERINLVGVVFALVLPLLVQPASAQATADPYPERPVRIVVPFAPGAGTDAMGRLVAQKLLVK